MKFLREQKAYFLGIPIPLPIFILGIIFCLIVFWGLRVSNAEKWRTFEDPEHRFTIDYPANWVASEIGDAGFRGIEHIRAIINDNMFMMGFDHSLWVYVLPLTHVSPDVLTQWGEENVSGNDDVLEMSDLSQLQIGRGNYTAYKREFTYQSKNWETTHYYLIPNENTVIVLDFWVNRPSLESEAVFAHMLESFTLIENN